MVLSDLKSISSFGSQIVLGVQFLESPLQGLQFERFLEQDAAAQLAEAPPDAKVVVAVDEGGELGDARRVILDWRCHSTLISTRVSA